MVLTADIRERINHVYQETETCSLKSNPKTIVIGSDDYLDLMNHLSKDIKRLTTDIELLVEELSADLHTYPLESATEIKYEIQALYASCIKLLSTVNNTVIYVTLKTTFQQFRMTVNNIIELISDIDNFKVKNNDSELEDLLNQM